MRALSVIAGLMASLLFVGAVVLGMASMQPDTMRVERSAVVGAAPEVVYDLMDDFRDWNRWQPQDGMDPDQTVTYEGPEAGVGAAYTWSGNDDVGRGRMEIVAAVPNRSITHDLQFLEPFEARHDVTLTIAPAPEGSEVTWVMTGDKDLMTKVFSLLFDLEGSIGADFERGLSQLDAVARAEAG